MDMLQSSPLFQLYLTRLRDFYRQPARIFWVYAFPTLLAIVLGFAFQNRPPAPIQVDLATGPGAGSIKAALDAHNTATEKQEATGRARMDVPTVALYRVEPAQASNSKRSSTGTTPGDDGDESHLPTLQDALKRLNTGKTPLVIEPLGSEAWVYHYDPTRPEAAAARQILEDILQQAAGRRNPRETRDVYVTEPGSRYIDFLIPGLIGLNTMGGGLWGIGFLLVNFRIGKLLKRFVATPMPRRDFLLALLGARLTFLLPDLAVLLLLGSLMFHMPIRGNLAWVILVDVVGALAFAGIGLLVACRVSTTEAVSGLMNLVMVPMWLFSGVFFSSDRFPHWAQWFIQALPLTQLVSALRRILLEGAGLIDVSPALAILAAWAIVTFSLALRFFRWT
jgi:ABC-type multidrug transport system permease subunit